MGRNFCCLRRHTLKKRIFKSLSLLFLSAFLASFEPFVTLKIDFQREVSGQKKEIIQGTIFYFQGKKLIKVNSPVHQIMFVKENSLVVYYPEEKQAFIFESARATSLPFFELFLLPSKKGYFLKKGFEIKDKNSFHILYRTPPSINSVIDEVEIFLDKKGRITKLVEKKESKITMEARFSNYVEFMGFSYPLKISVRARKTEKVFFSNPEFNLEIPEWVKNFKVPEGTKVKRVKL